MHPRRPVITLSAVLLFSSCASIFRSGEPGVTVESDPSGASVYQNGTLIGTTPFAYQVDPDAGDEVELELRMEGYTTMKLHLRPVENTAGLFGDAMLLNIPYYFEKNSANFHSFAQDRVMVPLYREWDKDLSMITVPISGFEQVVGTSESLGRVNGAPIKGSTNTMVRELQYTDMLVQSARQAVRGSWMDMPSARLATTHGEEAVRNAKVYVHPRLNKVTADLKGKSGRLNGPVELDLTWRFYSGFKRDSLLFELSTLHTHHEVDGQLNGLLTKAVDGATRRMLETEGLHDRLDLARKAGLMLSKGGHVRIKQPKPIGFTGRRDMLSALVNAVVTVETTEGHGSGFLISNDGYLLTNEHVVGRDSVVKVRFTQGITLDAEVVKVNKDFDLALLKAPAGDAPALLIGDDGNLLIGEELFAIGTPLITDLGQSVSRGILSGKREIEGHHYLQTDVSINPGNSGGPLIDESGRAVGVATLKISGKGLEGLGFGVPISVALDMLNIEMVP